MIPALVEIPQWQGSASRTARRLVPGAGLLAGLAPADEHLRVPLTNDAGETRDGVRHADVLADNLAAVRTLSVWQTRQPVMTVGGDCAVELAPIEAAVGHHGERLAVVWFDAHGDLNTPESSPSGAFHGMILRTLLGEGPTALAPEAPLRPSQVVLAGVRSLDPGEQDFIIRNSIRTVTVSEISANPATLVDAVVATGAEAVYVHIDLDVLDPTGFTSLGCPEPGGLTPTALTAAVRTLARRLPLAGIGITEYEPATPGDQETLAQLVPPLTFTLAQ